MRPIFFSIIIPHHETPELLARCLASIPQRDDTEIIVIDDNSTDGEEYPSKYPFLRRRDLFFVPTHEGKGGGYARNVGLEMAQGKWLLFADSDDFFTDALPEILDEYRDSDLEMVYFNVLSVCSDDISKPAHRDKDRLFEGFAKTDDINLFRVRYTEPWGKLIKRDLIKKNNIRFDEVRVCNDLWFCLLASFNAKNLIADNRRLYVATLREGSVCYNDVDTLEKILIRIDVHCRAYNYLKKHNIPEELMLKRIRSFMLQLLLHHKAAFFRELCAMPRRKVPLLKLAYHCIAPKSKTFRLYFG